MKRISGVGIILVMIGAFVLMTVLVMGATWAEWLSVIVTILLVGGLVLALMASGWLWSEVDRKLGALGYFVTVMVAPPVTLILLGAQWWAWFAMMGVGIVVIAAFAAAWFVLHYAVNLIMGK